MNMTENERKSMSSPITLMSLASVRNTGTEVVSMMATSLEDNGIEREMDTTCHLILQQKGLFVSGVRERGREQGKDG